MRKKLVVALLGMMIFSLTACNNGDEDKYKIIGYDGTNTELEASNSLSNIDFGDEGTGNVVNSDFINKVQGYWVGHNNNKLTLYIAKKEDIEPEMLVVVDTTEGVSENTVEDATSSWFQKFVVADDDKPCYIRLENKLGFLVDSTCTVFNNKIKLSDGEELDFTLAGGILTIGSTNLGDSFTFVKSDKDTVVNYFKDIKTETSKEIVEEVEPVYTEVTLPEIKRQPDVTLEFPVPNQ